MSVLRLGEPFHPTIQRDKIIPSGTWECQTARFSTNWLESSVAVVAAEGEVDAANADALVDYALRNALHCDRLVLDLSRLEFFGTEGFSALHMFNVRCAQGGVRWALVPSPAVARVLCICDPAGGLVAAGTVDAALAVLQGEPRRLLQLVRKS